MTPDDPITLAVKVGLLMLAGFWSGLLGLVVARAADRWLAGE